MYRNIRSPQPTNSDSGVWLSVHDGSEKFIGECRCSWLSRAAKRLGTMKKSLFGYAYFILRNIGVVDDGEGGFLLIAYGKTEMKIEG